MVDYSRAELNSMRMDAMRRTREMHSRAEKKPESRSSGQRESKGVQADFSAEKNTKQPGETLNQVNKSFIEELLPNVKMDGDKLLVILLVVLLAREGADMKLLLALLYIML